MPIFNTAELSEKKMGTLSANEASWIYNGLDCCVTLEVHDALLPQVRESNEVAKTYADALAKQAPYLEMSLRGIRIDFEERRKALARLETLLAGLEARFQRLVFEVFGHNINWRSPVQLKTFFYGEMGIAEIKKRNPKGQYIASVDEEALTRLQMHFYAQPYAKYILAMREIGKKVSFLKTEIDPDGRIRCNINVAGTDTGRLSSSANDFGTGTNLQNVDKTIRAPFIADPKMILVECDLEQADARNVGAILWNRYFHSHGAERAGAYLDACESGDLHTTVVNMVWDDLGWPNDRGAWREIADQPFLPGKSYRDACKALGHGTNYYGQPPTMSKHTGIATAMIRDFQGRYFRAFPLIQQWHEDLIQTIRTTGILTTMFGRRRHFFNRGNDKVTWRAAIAYEPQSMTGHEMDMGILQLWRAKRDVQLLMQVHDSILFQVPWHNHQTHIERALDLLRFEHELIGGRKFVVPLGAKAGWNWGSGGADNPFGLMKWKGEEKRQPPATKRLADFL